MMRGLVPGPQRVDQDDVEVGTHERKVVVAAIPDDDVGFRLGEVEDAGIVDAGEDDVARADVRLVLLALLDRARSRIEIREACEALHRLALEVAVGHGMAQDGDLQPLLPEQAGQPACRLRLAHARAHGADGDDGQARLEHGAIGAEQREVRSRQRARSRPCA